MPGVTCSHLCVQIATVQGAHLCPSLLLPLLSGNFFLPAHPHPLQISCPCLSSEEAIKARGKHLCPRERGSRRLLCNWTYRWPYWPGLSWGSFGSSWSSGPWWARGPRRTLDSCLSLFTLRFVKNKGLPAGRANPSHYHPKGPRQVSLAEAEEVEASPRLVPGEVSKSEVESR